MKPYLDLLRHVFDHGKYKADRTGTGTYSVFGAQVRYDLTEGFPLLTTKKLHTRSIFHDSFGSCAAKQTSATFGKMA